MGRMATETPYERLIGLVASQRRPPVASWHPEHVGEIDIRIAADGTWFHEGRPIKRQPLVNLFAQILRREADRYYLVTPVEKLAIRVEDAPFIAVDFEVSQRGGGDQSLVFQTNVGDIVPLDADHPLRVSSTGEPRPYVHVRDDLDALISRPAYYRLAELAVARGDDWVVWSHGTPYTLG